MDPTRIAGVVAEAGRRATTARGRLLVARAVKALVGVGVGDDVALVVDDDRSQPFDVAKVFTGKAKDQARTSLEQHNTRAKLRETPAQKGVKFEVPQLSIKFDDRVVPVENDLLIEDGFWNPADDAGTLDTLTFNTRTQTWEIDIGSETVRHNMVHEPQTEYLSGLTGDWVESDLLVWLEGKIVQNDVRQEAMIEWIAQALAPLKHKGYSLGQLVRGRFIIARHLLMLLGEALSHPDSTVPVPRLRPNLIDVPGYLQRIEHLFSASAELRRRRHHALVDARVARDAFLWCVG